MANCNRNRARAKFVSQKQVDKYQTVDFNIGADIDACAKINTRRYIDTDAKTAIYRSATVPADLINACESVGCKNSGTLFLETNETEKTVEGGKAYAEKAKALFTTVSDALDYAAGVLYFYVHVANEGKYTINATLSDITDTKQNAADKYTVEINAVRTGFYPVTIELAKAPQETIGKGWTPSTSGTAISIEVEAEKATQGTIMVGLSSIALFNDVEDLRTNEVVKVSCLTGADGDDTIDAVEEACQGAQHDSSTAAVERTVTHKQFTPNYAKLNPMYHDGDDAVGFAMRTVQLTVKEEGDYGFVHIADHNTEECGMIYASLEDSCNTTDSLLTRLSGPNLVTLDERQFQVINTKYNPDVEVIGSKLYFNRELVGRDVIVSYPQEVEAKHYFISDEEINERHVTMTYPKELSDGTIETLVYRNVFITSFPMGLTADNEAEKSLTISVKRDRNGRFYDVYQSNKADTTL